MSEAEGQVNYVTGERRIDILHFLGVYPSTDREGFADL
jgi:hypothetical protein